MNMRENKQSRARYIICVKNKNYQSSLEVRKLYRVVTDISAESRGLLHVVDESGEDYLYPAGHFVPIELPKQVEDALMVSH
jgi:hypothetical protein